MGASTAAEPSPSGVFLTDKTFEAHNKRESLGTEVFVNVRSFIPSAHLSSRVYVLQKLSKYGSVLSCKMINTEHTFCETWHPVIKKLLFLTTYLYAGN
jgi:hypothetical protein